MTITDDNEFREFLSIIENRQVFQIQLSHQLNMYNSVTRMKVIFDVLIRTGCKPKVILNRILTNLSYLLIRPNSKKNLLYTVTIFITIAQKIPILLDRQITNTSGQLTFVFALLETVYSYHIVLMETSLKTFWIIYH